MLKKLKQLFIDEIKSDSILELDNNFYNEVREYIKNIEGLEKKRALYFYRNLRKVRIYKSLLFGCEENLTEEEKEILNMIFDLKLETKKEDSCIEPQHINIINDIEVVRVLKNFPSFIFNGYICSLNKEDIITLDKKVANILKKHNIIEEIRWKL
ncbi:hypothetical protein ACPB8Q_04910 [Methanocaldococcus indicus]|uniref:hypothetical protein n=1 Tax=Methanocaldococcus indicus TaxID=213231 RepID=UPI003C6CC939